jgi:hypothetical protein
MESEDKIHGLTSTNPMLVTSHGTLDDPPECDNGKAEPLVRHKLNEEKREEQKVEEEKEAVSQVTRVRFQILKAEIMKMTVFRGVVPCRHTVSETLVNSYETTEHNALLALKMEAVSASDTYISLYDTAQSNIPEDSHLQVTRGSLKLHFLSEVNQLKRFLYRASPCHSFIPYTYYLKTN